MYVNYETGAKYKTLQAATVDFCTTFRSSVVYGDCKSFCPLFCVNTEDQNGVYACSERHIQENPDDVMKRLNLCYIDEATEEDNESLNLILRMLQYTKQRRNETIQLYRQVIACVRNLGVSPNSLTSLDGYTTLMEVISDYVFSDKLHESEVVEEIHRILKQSETKIYD